MTDELTSNSEQARHWIEEVAHELRNPLTILQQGLRLLSESKSTISESNVMLINMLASEVARMQRLVANLLNVTHISRGHYPIQKERINVDLFLARCLQYFTIHHPNVTIQSQLSACSIEADPDLLKQILDNLLTNAIKHLPTENGLISVGAKKATMDHQNGIEFWVDDNGTGIAPDDLAHIFDRYKQSGKHDTRKKGVGLGLSIVRHALELHGGKIEIDSQLNQGTTVRFFLPTSQNATH